MRVCLIVIMMVPLSVSAKWKPNYWNIYGNFSVGTNSFGKFMISGSANLTVNHLYLGLDILAQEMYGSSPTDYDFNLGAKIFQNKRSFSVIASGIGYFTYRTWHNGDPVSLHSYSIPTVAKVYYTPLRWLALDAQVFFSFNKIKNYGGVIAGISLGLFNWTNIQYYK